MKTEMWGMPFVVDHQNQIVYLKCSSAITAMGIPAIVKQYYPGYTGKLVSMEHLKNFRDQFIN